MFLKKLTKTKKKKKRNCRSKETEKQQDHYKSNKQIRNRTDILPMRKFVTGKA